MIHSVRKTKNTLIMLSNSICTLFNFTINYTPIFLGILIGYILGSEIPNWYTIFPIIGTLAWMRYT